MNLKASLKGFCLGVITKLPAGDEPGEITNRATQELHAFVLSAGRIFIMSEDAPVLSDQPFVGTLGLGIELLYRTDASSQAAVWGVYTNFEQLVLDALDLHIGSITMRPNDCGDMGYVESEGTECLLLHEDGSLLRLTDNGQLEFVEDEVEMPQAGERLIFRLGTEVPDLASPWAVYRQFRDLLFSSVQSQKEH